MRIKKDAKKGPGGGKTATFKQAQAGRPKRKLKVFGASPAKKGVTKAPRTFKSKGPTGGTFTERKPKGPGKRGKSAFGQGSVASQIRRLETQLRRLRGR